MTSKSKLSRDSIIETAIDLLGKYGSSLFSMRKLATRLGVDPMAIYHYFPNRAALISKLVDSVVNEANLPDANAPWQSQVKSISHLLRDVAKRHPGLLLIYNEHSGWVHSELLVMESMHAAFESAGFDKQSTISASRLVLMFTESFCSWEQTQWSETFTPEKEQDLREHLDQGTYPATRRHFEELTAYQPDAEFEFGLNALIKGLEATQNKG